MTIILTAAQAAQVRGYSPRLGYSALWPVPLTDGTFMLPDDVVNDPANADVKDFLTPLVGQVVSPAVLPLNPPLAKLVAPNAVQISAGNAYASVVLATPTIRQAGVRTS